MAQDNSSGEKDKSFSPCAFLEKIWSYTSRDARCFAIAYGSNYRHKYYCIESLFSEDEKREIIEWAKREKHSVVFVKTADEIVPKVAEDVEKLIDKPVYYGVLPLTKPPRKAENVKVALYLFADFDYKGERPSKEELLKMLEPVGIPTILIDSGRGYHALWKLKYEVDAGTWRKLQSALISKLKNLGLPADANATDPSRLLRMPGSVNPRNGRRAAVVHYDPFAEYEPEARSDGFRVLSSEDMEKIREVLKEAYREGYRQKIILFLSGWLAKAKVHPLSAIKLAKFLHDTLQDSDSIKMRLGAVVYTYKKYGIDVDRYAEEIERIAGVRPYGLEKEINESAIAGYTGLQQVLEEAVGADKAYTILSQLEEILETASPYRDSIFIKLDDEKNLFIVVDFKSKMIRRYALKDGKWKPKERILAGVFSEVHVYINPIGGIPKYSVVLEPQDNLKAVAIGPATEEEVKSRIIAEGRLLLNPDLFSKYFQAILLAYIQKKRAVIHTEIESPGYYQHEGKIIAVGVNLEVPSKEELRDALLLLNELAENWFGHAKEKFATAVKWGLISPFGYVYKQRGKWIPWLFLYGYTGTGKTTIGEIILKLHGLGPNYIKGPGHIDNIARLGAVVSQSTFPVLVNEVGELINREDMREILKHAIEQPTIRGKYVSRTYVEIPALSAFILTSNSSIPKDPAVERRLLVITFYYNERISDEKAKEFSKVKQKLDKLKAIGSYVAHLVLSGEAELGDDYMETAKALLKKAYEHAGLKPPDWLEKIYVHNSSVADEIKELIRMFMLKSIISGYTEVVKQKGLRDDATLEQKIEEVAKNNAVPWMLFSAEDGFIKITSGIKYELEKIIGHIEFESLIDLLGWGRCWTKKDGRSNRAMCVRAKDLAKFLDPTL